MKHRLEVRPGPLHVGYRDTAERARRDGGVDLGMTERSGVAIALQLLLPADLLRRLDPAELQALLVHELAHQRRRDHWVRRFELLVAPRQPKALARAIERLLTCSRLRADLAAAARSLVEREFDITRNFSKFFPE